ncbi:MAG: hypothetical protein V3V08_25190, partial [Nannocystaceae bacterium]
GDGDAGDGDAGDGDAGDGDAGDGDAGDGDAGDGDASGGGGMDCSLVAETGHAIGQTPTDYKLQDAAGNEHTLYEYCNEVVYAVTGTMW